MIIDFRSRPPFKSFATNTALFPRKIDEDFDDVKQIPALNKYCGDMESARKCDMNLYLREMDEAGIDIAVVHGRKTKTEGYVRNEDIEELMQLYPGRFIGFAGVDLSDIDGALAEMERCKALGFKGISVEAGYETMYFDDKRLFPLYEKCIELDFVCSMTSSIFVGPDLSYSNPIHIQHVANCYPELIIAVDHGCWPYVQEMLGVALICPNVYLYPDFYGYIPNMPMADEFVKAANYYMEYRMMFGSGYPIRAMKQSVEQFQGLDFKEGILDNLMCNNAKRILKL